MRILQTPLEVAGQAGLTARSLRELGQESKAFFLPHPFGYSDSSDYRVSNFGPLGKIQRVLFAPYAALHFDVLHFHNGTSLIPKFHYIDARLAVKAGNKVVVEFWGSDARMPSIEIARNPFYFPLGRENDDTAIDRMSKWAEVTKGHVIVSDHFADEFLCKYFSSIHVVGQRVDVESIQVKPLSLDSKRRVILHAPSDEKVKGTETIRAAVKDLQKRGHPIDYVELNGVPASEVAGWIQKADLVIDQIRLGTHGLFALEAMAAAKPVICYLAPYWKPPFGERPPIISANPDNLVSVIENSMSDFRKLRAYGLEGRKYVETHHNLQAVGQRLLMAYSQLPTE